MNVTLGKTELEVSPICIGAWQLAGPLWFGGKPDGHPDPGKKNVLRLIQELGDMGVNFIDTAEQYGNGESERRVGEAIKGKRDQWIVSTKFGYRVGSDGNREDDSSPGTIRSSIEGSLQRLRSDYIDIYLYHCPPNIDDLNAGKAVLDALVKEGKCRFYGISTNDITIIQAMLAADMLDVLQYNTSMLREATDIYELVTAHNVGTQVRGVMAQGRLSGKYFAHQPTWDPNDNRSNQAGKEDFRRYAVFEPYIPDGYTMSQVAIRYMLDLPGNHSICLGAKTRADYKVALKALELPPLDETVRAKLATCAAALR
ncbi:MAG: aldo/keto reductase [Kiritimatiellia bacterium]